MTNKQLGTLAIIGAPAMFLGVYLETSNASLKDTWFTGAWGIIYITAWMCSLLVFYRNQVAGDGFGKWLMRVMFVTLTIANISNVIQLLAPNNKPAYFFYIDMCWPLSNVLLLVLGITIAIKGRLQGAARYIPLAAGLWLPIALGSLAVFGESKLMFFLTGLYSAIMWTLMGIVARNLPEERSQLVVQTP
jgi:hypothetical protein